MTPRDLIQQTALRFQMAGVPDSRNDAALLLAHVTGRDALSLRLDMDTVLSAETLEQYEILCQQREKREPLQYMLGSQPFYGRNFHVDRRVLIPRPETELLAVLAIAALQGKPSPSALDLCCGSGCIAVTMALECPDASVHAADLSRDALAVTEANAIALGARLALHQGDLFAAVEGHAFDVIVSNPPYIPAEECKVLQEEVRKEPLMALDGGVDGLDFYRRIAEEAPKHLLPGGVLLLEVGWDQGQAVAELLRQAGFVDVCLHRDYQDIERMVEGRWRP